MKEVFEQLQCSREGLTSEEGQKRLQVFGLNKLEEEHVTFSKFSDNIVYSPANISFF